MYINKHKSKNKKKIIIISLLLIIIFITTSFLIFQKQKNITQTPHTGNNLNLTPATTDEVVDGNNTKKNTLENKATDGSTQSLLSANISALNQNGSTLQIRLLIQGNINLGTCTATLTKNSISKVYTVKIQANSSYSTCEGFDIPVSDLGLAGDWNVGIEITTGAQNVKLNQKVIIK